MRIFLAFVLSCERFSARSQGNESGYLKTILAARGHLICDTPNSVDGRDATHFVCEELPYDIKSDVGKDIEWITDHANEVVRAIGDQYGCGEVYQISSMKTTSEIIDGQKHAAWYFWASPC